MSEHRQYRRIRAACERVYGSPDLVVRGPGRINLIGEHTDAALGLVMPAAIDKGVWLALRTRDDAQCRFHAADRDESFETAVATGDGAAPGWSRYLLGVYAEMSLDGRAPRGVECVFGGDLPIGSGLSSSAALTCGLAFGLNELFALGYERLALAQLGRRVEHRHAGVQCGLMDQFASLLGRAGHVVQLDCRDLSHLHLPFAETGLAIVLCDSHVRRSLAANGAYNQRRAQCDEGLALLRSRHPEVQSLRDVTIEMLQAARPELNQVVFARCDYVLQENARVVDFCAALESGDLERLGRLMNESHRGLQFDFEVSCPELDTLADAARRVPGVVGSRMMGAGFGGCTISLVGEEALPRFEEDMTAVYREVLRAEPESGVRRVVCFSPRHDLSLSRMSQVDVLAVVETWTDETRRLGGRDDIACVQIFENRGEAMGCSNPHPHGQIWATEHLPNETVKELAHQERYFARHERPLLADVLAEELASGDRIVLENEGFVAFVPFWAAWPFETIVVPRRPLRTLLDLHDDDRGHLADVLRRLTTHYDNLFETSFPYSMGFHQAPFDGRPHPEWTLHLHVYPPLLRGATVRKFMVGFEMLAMPGRDLTPEDAAARLRGLPDVHYLVE